MTPSISSYQKLYSQFISPAYPEISELQVKKPDFPFSVISAVSVDIFLRPTDRFDHDIKRKICVRLLSGITEKIHDLNRYLGQKTTIDLNIYYGGEVICHDIINW